MNVGHKNLDDSLDERLAENKGTRLFFLLAILLLGIFTRANAQKIALYQEASANYTNIRAIDPFPYPFGKREDIGNKANFGFEAGFVLKFIPKWERLAFPVGLHFQRKGFHIKPDGPVFAIGSNGNLVAFKTDRIGYRFDFLTVTPAMEYAVVRQKLGLSFGTYLAFRLKEAVKIYDHTGWEDDAGDTFINKTDYGLQVGAHAYLGRFGLLVKYQYGLQKNDKFATVDENFQPTGFLYFRNQAAVLGLSYRLTKS
jgi:Outer membrane protein beta-barrel domain